MQLYVLWDKLRMTQPYQSEEKEKINDEAHKHTTEERTPENQKENNKRTHLSVTLNMISPKGTSLQDIS